MQPDDSTPSTQQLQERIDQAQANSKLLGELVDHSQANVFAADRNFRLLAINRTAQETFRRLRGFVPQVGDYIPQFIANQPDIVKWLEPVWPRVLAGEAFTDIITLGPADAPRHYEISYNTLRDAQQRIQGGYLFAYDISERVAEQERVRKIEEALRQSQKMEAVGQLTGGIAHDFNNLLGGIFGALELAEQRQAEQHYHDTTRLLGIARQNAQRAAALVQRLLAFSRQQTLVPQAVDVQQLVAGMHELIASSLDARITFIDQTQAGQWRVQIDPNQLENALLNLCINARDAMPLGGTLRIASENTQLADVQARLLELPSGAYLHVSVCDNGIGMPAEVLQRAFEPFFTTKPLGQGSGLGLSIVYGFVRQSGGQLRITSEPGQGACIHLYLPRAACDTTAQAGVQPQAPSEQPRAAPQVVMLVEDQDTLRLLISEVLEDQGHHVQAFSDGRSALEALQTGLRPDLLITDIGLPGGIDGYQVAAACQKLSGTVAVLYITGYASNRVDASPGQHCAVLFKPFDLATLNQQVARLLENRHSPL
ncbi:PAS domain-containing sensor histidine kinase [Pseudomonas sp. CC120222-01a]|uniref:PAS domain-containing sensor histidine kinase n=1 Tax=Pseudomonas sp. CC120222-01a TaxID=1378075 RepID=UPI000D8B6DBB|nr:PAS domain-containing sensor histidine kinase [Pseudomonas sp. CC120222-01a]PVZ39632.1 signal transduction histidine kinase [Pseudomonas sp. CC120222-01a]